MVAGMERYYQIARCYRDEDFRADRQPEFTQLDIEMSFVDQDDIIALSEEILTALWKLVGYDVQTPIPRMTYAEAMARFGSDKPDLRMGLELVECTEYFKNTPFRVFQAPYVGAVVMPGGADQPRKQLDAWQDWAKQRGARGLAYVLVGQDGELGGPVAKNLSDEERAGIADHVGAKPGDCIFFAAGPVKSSRALLGAARLEIGRRGGLIDESAWSFVWVVDAPLFEPADEATAAGDVAVGSGAWTAVHHAFTSPKPDSMATFDTDPGSALAYAYDIVCNGNEIGGGSIRIHREDVQKRVFKVMGLTDEEASEKFGFLLDAFKFGAPPHGGIAFGWDRITALLAGTESIRDVIAFPKSGGGFDPLTAAPAPITPAAAQGGRRRRQAGAQKDKQPSAVMRVRSHPGLVGGEVARQLRPASVSCAESCSSVRFWVRIRCDQVRSPMVCVRRRRLTVAGEFLDVGDRHRRWSFAITAGPRSMPGICCWSTTAPPGRTWRAQVCSRRWRSAVVGDVDQVRHHQHHVEATVEPEVADRRSRSSRSRDRAIMSGDSSTATT